MGNELNMHGSARDSRTSRGIRLAERAVIALCIVLLAALACYMWTRPDPERVGTSDRPQRFALNLTDQVNIDPQLIDYVQIASIAVAGDEIFIADAGNRMVWRLSATGKVLGEIGQADGFARFQASSSLVLTLTSWPVRRDFCTASIRASCKYPRFHLTVIWVVRGDGLGRRSPTFLAVVTLHISRDLPTADSLRRKEEYRARAAMPVVARRRAPTVNCWPIVGCRWRASSVRRKPGTRYEWPTEQD